MNIFERLLIEIDSLKNPLERKFLNSLKHGCFSLPSLLSSILERELADNNESKKECSQWFLEAFNLNKELEKIIVEDINQYLKFDYSANHLYEIIFFRKGFQSLVAYRVSHFYEQKGLHVIAEWIRHRCSIVFQVDISPKAKIGKGTVLDHATGIVIGETATIGDYCSIFHNVTLGSTAKNPGIRHPMIGDNVLIGCGASILGNVEIKEGVTVSASKVIA